MKRLQLQRATFATGLGALMATKMAATNGYFQSEMATVGSDGQFTGGTVVGGSAGSSDYTNSGSTEIYNIQADDAYSVEFSQALGGTMIIGIKCENSESYNWQVQFDRPILLPNDGLPHRINCQCGFVFDSTQPGAPVLRDVTTAVLAY